MGLFGGNDKRSNLGFYSKGGKQIEKKVEEKLYTCSECDAVYDNQKEADDCCTEQTTETEEEEDASLEIEGINSTESFTDYSIETNYLLRQIIKTLKEIKDNQ